MRRRFRVVKTNDPAAVFDDLDTLREAMPAVVPKRARTAETFARIPHERARELWPHISSAGWMILIEIDRLILKGRGRNPLKLSNQRLRELGISKHAKHRQLRKLEAAGVVKVHQQRREATVILHLWFPNQT
jgi:hypothetical protein